MLLDLAQHAALLKLGVKPLQGAVNGFVRLYDNFDQGGFLPQVWLTRVAYYTKSAFGPEPLRVGGNLPPR